MGAMKVNAVLIAVFVVAGCSTAPTPTVSSTVTQSPSPTVRPVADQDLQLRPVLTAEPAAKGACPPPHSAEPASTSPIKACSVDGTVLYSLGPAAVTGGQVATLAVGDSSAGGGAEIDVTLDAAGSTALTSITEELSVKSPPQSQLAIYVLGQVQSAPTVSEAILGGAVVISGDFTTSQAQEIVDGLLQH